MRNWVQVTSQRDEKKDRTSQQLCKKLKAWATFHDETFIADACLVHSDLFTVLKKRETERDREKERSVLLVPTATSE